MAEIVDKAILQDDEYLKALKRIESGINRMTDQAEKRFAGVSKSASASGVQIGATAGVVSALTTKFIELGQRAVGALVDITKESVGLAKNLEVTEKVFKGVFGKGNEKAALAALGAIREESRALGVDLTETAASFLPFVSSIEQLKRIGKIGSALAISQPEQGATGVRVALQEALSGNARSLVQRFEIPKEFGKALQDALDEGGIEAFLGKFEEILQLMGRDIETLGGGLAQAQGKAQIAGQQIQEAFGKPVVAELTEQLNTLTDTLSNNFDDIELIADAFGRVAANVTEIIGTGLNDFLAGIDSEQITRIAEKLFDITEDARLLVETMAGANFPQSFIDGVETFANKMDEALNTAIQLNLLSQAGAAKANAEQEEWIKYLERMHGAGTLTTEVFEQLVSLPGAIQASNALAEYVGNEEAVALAARSASAGQEAYNKVLIDGTAAIDEAKQSKEENRQATDDLAEAQKKSTDAGLEEADAFLAQREAAEALNAALEGLAELEAEVAEKTAKAVEKNQQAIEDATTDHERKIVDIATEAARKRFDAAQDFANKRVDLARDNLQKIADLERDYERDLENSARDLSRDIEDAQRDAGRAQIEQAKDEAQQQLDIETEHRRRIFDLRKKFDEDLGEYERTRDAVGFLRTVRQRESEISQAQTDRQRSIEDTRREGEQKRLEIQAQLEQQLEDARLADARRREDALIALEQGLEDQRENYARQQEELTLAEERKAEEIRLWQERQIEDANLAFERKLADLQLALEREIAAIKAAEEAKRAEFQATVDAAKAAAAEIAAAMAQSASVGDTGRPSSRPGAINRQRQYASQPSSRPGFHNRYPGFAQGGSFIVGGSGGTDSQIIPIRVTPGERVDITPAGQSLINQKNALVPPNPMLMSNMSPRSTVSNISNSRSQNINFPVNDTSVFDDPIFAAKVKNILRSELSELL